MATVYLTEDAISQLNFIEREGLRPGRYTLPDFLIVGPPRTGTTWLHRNLQFHPQVYMANPKEIIFFDRLDQPEDFHFKSNRLEWYSSFFSLDWRQELRTLLANWRAFGLPYRIKARGEATASYVIMEEAKIREIFVLNPRTRIIAAVRNPVDRAWSDVKKHLASDLALKRHFDTKPFADIDFETFARFYTTNYMLRCGQFTENIARWKRVFGPEQVFVYAFRDIARRPRALLAEISQFLGVSRREHVFQRQLYQRVVHRITDLEMPEEHRRFLRDFFRDEIESLNQQYGFSF